MPKKPYFIAEVSSNHNQDLNRCLEFVSVASAQGFDAIKFQLFTKEDLFAPEILSRSSSHRNRSNYELPRDFVPAIKEHCQRTGIDFGVTPFALGDVPFLDQYVDFFKVASYELLWSDLLCSVAQTKKPLVVSTGMSTIEEVSDAVSQLRDCGAKKLTLLHCISAYPTPVSDANLAAIQTLRGVEGVQAGWSDHSHSAAVIYRAVHRWDAEMVEVHIDLDGEGFEYGPGHCWLPEEIGEVIANVNDALQADGSGVKGPVDSENADRAWRADPFDGLRPLREVRADFAGDG